MKSFQNFPTRIRIFTTQRPYNILVYKLFTFAFLLLTYGCVDPYNPPAIEQSDSFLVVDGYLDAGKGRSTIKLSKTQNLSTQGKSESVSKAKVSIEEEEGIAYTLTENENGIYTISNLNLNNTRKYRLSIKTINGSQYYSDFITTQQTPKIDSISWESENDGVQLYVNSHDPSNNTWYYRWEYDETWEFFSKYQSSFELKDLVVIPKTDRENINQCWRTEKSNNIILGSSFRQSQDVIQNFPLIFIPSTSDKTKVKYSILVRQYALSLKAYKYWQDLKRNTESLGTLFDPQPIEVTGNIRSVSNPDELVFGFFEASSIETFRIFIRSEELPPWKRTSVYDACKMDTIKPRDWEPAEFATSGYTIIQVIIDHGSFSGYGVTPTSCVDCRLRGTNVRPDFWQ